MAEIFNNKYFKGEGYISADVSGVVWSKKINDGNDGKYIKEQLEKINPNYKNEVMVEQLCDRITIMDRGRQVASGTSDELKAMIGTGERIRIEVVRPRPAGRGDPGVPAPPEARAHRLLAGPGARRRVRARGAQPSPTSWGRWPGRARPAAG